MHKARPYELKVLQTNPHLLYIAAIDLDVVEFRPIEFTPITISFLPGLSSTGKMFPFWPPRRNGFRMCRIVGNRGSYVSFVKPIGFPMVV